MISAIEINELPHGTGLPDTARDDLINIVSTLTNVQVMQMFRIAQVISGAA